MSAPQQAETIREVKVIQTASVSMPDSVTGLGTVHASETSQLSAQIMGVVMTVNAREGDRVKRGQVLVALDSSQSQASLDRAQAALASAQQSLLAAKTDRDLAESTLKRYATLFERKSVSPQEFDEVKARHAGAVARADAAAATESEARASVSQAESGITYTRIRAPFDGVVTERKVDPGAMATPGTPLLTVEGSGNFRAEVTIDESSLRFVHLGADVPLALEAYPDQPLRGRVAQIVPSADPGSRTFLVKIELPRASQIRSGLSVRANFSRGTRDALLIPRTAVVERGATKAVYVVDQDQLASLRYITIGQSDTDRLEVLSGLAPKETIVASPAGRELGGKRIEVLP